MAVNGTTQNLNATANARSTNSGITENPNGALDKEAFLKLLLVELKYQDPTEPMDSGKILTQTSQLATLEAANNTNKAMEGLVAKLNKSMDMGSLAAIGKMASLGSNAVTLPKYGSAKFEVYFKEEIKTGTMTIIDRNGDVVRKIDLKAQAGKNGVLAFEWDGYDNNGAKLPPGYYGVKAEYIDADKKQQKTQFGIYPVESVRFENGQALMKLGSSYVPMKYIKEFF